MMTGLLLITHGRLGDDMLDTAKEILTACPLATASIAVNSNSDPDQLLETANRLCDDLDNGDGLLILTDLYGSTPSNIANRLIDTHNASVISGANLPMLLRILNYPEMSLEALCDKAASGARDGIVVTRQKQAS
ncbi:MAG: PTS fructose transporter subunit IIA [Gammaproteobacteria bacterium]|nr:MAG: PTS fructose transporter subunit IIA [Gammaproteobacteria bacterium]